MENFKHFNVEPSRCMLQAIQKSVSIFSFSWKAVFVRIIQFNVIDSMNFTSHDNKLDIHCGQTTNKHFTMTIDVQIKIRFLEDILHLPLKQNNICGECKEASIGWTHTLAYCVLRLYVYGHCNHHPQHCCPPIL